MGGICSGALQTGHSSMQASVFAEKTLQQEHTMKRRSTSFCNSCADMFLIKVSIILKNNVEIVTSESEAGKQPNTHNYNEKLLILQLGC